MSIITASRFDAEYGKPLQPRILIKSLDDVDTYFTWSPMEDVREFNLQYIDVERAAGETGVFNMVIEDSQNALDKDNLRNKVVWVEFGKTVETLIPWFIGYVDIFTIRRPRSFYQEYLLTGPSTKIQAAELFLLMRKAADDPNNPLYGCANVIIDSIKEKKWRPLNLSHDDIEHITGDQGSSWIAKLVTEGGAVSDSLNQLTYPVINEVLTTEWDFLDRMAALTGASWDVDYRTDFRTYLTFKYPGSDATGVVIKSSDIATISDDPAATSYIYSDFSIEDNASTDAGVATTLYTTTTIDTQVVSSQNTNNGSSNLVDKALAQQVIIDNDQRRINTLFFILSKVGDPHSSKERVNGDLVLDDGSNSPKNGQILATFSIPLEDIQSTATTIFVNDVNVKVRLLTGQNKIWIRLFQRSGADGSPNNDPTNTILWHHNANFSAGQSVYTATSTGATKGDYQQKSTMTWSSGNSGPIFCYSILSNIRRLQARTDSTQAHILRKKEAFIDTSFINNVDQNNQFLSRVLEVKSKARRSIQNFKVTNPNSFLFKPYQTVDFNDNLSQQFQTMMVERARYVVSALGGDSVIGAPYCELSLSASFNALIGESFLGGVVVSTGGVVTPPEQPPELGESFTPASFMPESFTT